VSGPRSQAFVGGAFVDAADGRTFAAESPRDGTVVADVTRGQTEDVARAVRAARAAFERGDWALADPASRGCVLVALADLMDERLEELAQLESRDTGHPIADARSVDVPSAPRCFRWYGEAIGWGIFYNAGQTCHAGSRVVVERPVREELVARLREVAGRFVPSDPRLDSTVLGALISDEHLEGVLGRVERARSAGAQVILGGSRAEPVAGGAYMEPTLIEAIDSDMPIVQEEVFGPVLVIQEAQDRDDALALANDTRYGLAAALWTSDLRTAGRLARRLRAGTVWVNTFDASSLATPFGGMRDSGHGRDRSLHALDAYTQLKTTWISLA
jgi:acyl-CoA reductase-like NAD-dependent aldehyde dehydrogenase